ncbi:MAG: glycosyltransferase, partial [Phycisphaerae bacterium]|nr:glycosyltransferase [Phycisphaerae bacterium]
TAAADHLVTAGWPRGNIVQVAPVTGDALECVAPEDVRRRLDVPDDAPLLALVPPVRRDTGGFLAVWATLLLAQIRPDARLVVLGAGRESARMRRLTVACRHPQVLRIMDGGCTVADLLAATDAALFLPDGRAPVAGLLWAMAAGRPIVAADTPFVRQMLRHQHDALLCATHAPKPVTAALLKLLEDPDDARALGRAACESYRRITNECEGVAGYEGIHERLVTPVGAAASVTA